MNCGIFTKNKNTMFYKRPPRVFRKGGGGASVVMTGLTSGEARPGTHATIGYTIDPDNGTDTAKWSNSSNASDPATYGTGANPTNFTAGDGGTLYLHVTDGGETVTVAAPIGTK